MASIIRQVDIAAPPERVWAAIADVAGVHRLAPGLVVATDWLGGDPPVRRVHFRDGLVLHERIISCGDGRLVWSITDDMVQHHNGALAMTRLPDAVRVTWTADVLPDALAAPFTALMEEGLALMRQALLHGPAA